MGKLLSELLWPPVTSVLDDMGNGLKGDKVSPIHSLMEATKPRGQQRWDCGCCRFERKLGRFTAWKSTEGCEIMESTPEAGSGRSWGSLSGELSVPVLLLLCALDASREGQSSSGITALTLLSNWTCGNCHLLKSAWLGWLLQTESDVKTSLLYLTPGQMFEQISKEAQI